MTIEKMLLSKWKKLKSPQDFKKMAAVNKSYSERFARAFRTGICNEETFVIIADFYNEKIKLINSYKKNQ